MNILVALTAASLVSLACTFAGAATPAPSPAPANPQPKLDKVSDSQVLKWKDGKTAVFLLAFDDACPSHLTNAIPELRKRNMVGTFYVIAGNGNFKDHPEWAEQVKSGAVVLGNHTLSHSDVSSVAQLDEQLAKANDAMNQRVPGLKPDRLVSFGQPGGVKWTVTNDEIEAALPRHNLVNRPPFWGAAIHVKTVEDAGKLVDAAIAKGEMGHLDFHGVGGDWLSASMEFYNGFLDKLDAERGRGQLWITDHISYHKYQAERKAAAVKVITSDPRQIRLQLTSTMDPSLYDQPLTLVTRVPSDWSNALVTQGQTKLTIPAADGIIRYDALPGPQEITLQPAP